MVSVSAGLPFPVSSWSVLSNVTVATMSSPMAYVSSLPASEVSSIEVSAGGGSGVAEAWFEGGPSPAALLARTSKVYCVPLSRFVTVCAGLFAPGPTPVSVQFDQFLAVSFRAR